MTPTRLAALFWTCTICMFISAYIEVGFLVVGFTVGTMVAFGFRWQQAGQAEKEEW